MGVSVVIGTLLMTVMTVVMAMAFAEFLSQAQPETQATLHVDLGARLETGPGQWGEGDESLVVTHRGGQALERAVTTIMVTIDGFTTSYSGAALDGGFADGELGIGETWTLSRSIAPGQAVSVNVVSDRGRPQLIATSELRAGVGDCSGDSLPPAVASWTQEPSGVTWSTTGSVKVTATATDGCAGVDTGATPHLVYRIDDGTGPAFTDLGAMTHLSGASWQASIPAPAAGWDDHATETLEYRLTGLTDLRANSGNSSTRSDVIDAPVGGGGTLTYATGVQVFTGSVDNETWLMNGTDASKATNLTEAPTTGGAITSEMYATSHSSFGALAPGNVTGSPDDRHAEVDDDGDWVSARGFATFSGPIRSVELAFEAHTSGAPVGPNDDMILSYVLDGTTVEAAVYDKSNLAVDTDGPAEYVNVTADRSWTWNDIQNLQVKSEYSRHGNEDNATFYIDALWIRVTYESPGYQALAQVNITGVPNGTQVLELEYAAVEETFDVRVYNWTSGLWADRGGALSRNLSTSWTLQLTDDELSSGEVRVRFADAGPDPDARDRLALDYVRVRTT